MVSQYPSIPTNETADIGLMTEELGRAIDIHPLHNTQFRVWLFGSWASPEKPFTKADVDVFVGFEEFDKYGPNEAQANQGTITVYSSANQMYDDCLIDLQYGTSEEFLQRVPEPHRIELDAKAFR